MLLGIFAFVFSLPFLNSTQYFVGVFPNVWAEQQET
jgi:hypothetical protein